MTKLSLDHVLLPPKLAMLRGRRAERFTLLDVGCGNHSASRTKRWFPRCRYFGLDRQTYNNDAGDFALMERFYQADLETSDLSEVPDGFFDAVVCAHVLEHLRGGLALVERLPAKLGPGGELYVEFPSVRSLGLPSARGTLNFCDDASHVRVYSVREVSNLLLAQGLVIRRAGRRRSWSRAMLTPLVAAASWVRDGSPGGGSFWDLTGFADFVWAARPPVGRGRG
jgi:SAM-dependent methyltransferase